MSTVGIVVPAYNAEAYLYECLSSVSAQTMTNFRCVVVDDGSTDGTFALARSLSAQDERFQVLRLDLNQGQSAAKNRGAAFLEDVQYLFFLDSDDRIRPEFLDTVCNFLDSHPNAVAVGTQFAEFSETVSEIPAHRSRFVPGVPLPRDLRPDETKTPTVTYFCVTGQGPFYVYRRDSFVGYDETLMAHEDADLLISSSLLGDVHMLPERLYVKRHRANSMTVLGQNRGSGSLFHSKWMAASLSANAPKVLRRAAIYYLMFHSPLRDLKVAWQHLRAFRVFAATRLVLHAVAGLLGLTLVASWFRYGRS